LRGFSSFITHHHPALSVTGIITVKTDKINKIKKRKAGNGQPFPAS